MHGFLKMALVIVLAVLFGFRANADDPSVSLFKVVTVKDDVVVGLSKEALASMGRGAPLDVFAGELQRRGQMSMWQYASTKNAQGELVMSAVRRVNILYNGTARIEPYSTTLKVMPAN